MLHLDSTECGPTVLPTLRTAVKWVCARLVMDPPNMDEPSIVALQHEVINKRAETLREAVPIPSKVVGCLEEFVVDDSFPLGLSGLHLVVALPSVRFFAVRRW